MHREPVPLIYVEADESNVTKVSALIIGPLETPYAGGFFRFEMLIGPEYPMGPPTVTLTTTDGGRVRFNPNLYCDGSVCLSILGTWSGPAWSSAESLSTVLLSIQSLMCPDPYLNEPGYAECDVDASTKQAYNDYVRYETLRVAVVGEVKHLMTLQYPQYEPQSQHQKQCGIQQQEQKQPQRHQQQQQYGRDRYRGKDWEDSDNQKTVKFATVYQRLFLLWFDLYMVMAKDLKKRCHGKSFRDPFSGRSGVYNIALIIDDLTALKSTIWTAISTMDTSPSSLGLSPTQDGRVVQHPHAQPLSSSSGDAPRAPSSGSFSLSAPDLSATVGGSGVTAATGTGAVDFDEDKHDLASVFSSGLPLNSADAPRHIPPRHMTNWTDNTPSLTVIPTSPTSSPPGTPAALRGTANVVTRGLSALPHASASASGGFHNGSGSNTSVGSSAAAATQAQQQKQNSTTPIAAPMSESLTAAMSAYSYAKDRLHDEYRHLLRHPHPGGSASPRDPDGHPFVWDATVLGPENTPWEGGLFPLEMRFSARHPYEPPFARFTCAMTHPNITSDGVPALDCIQTRWTSTTRIGAVLDELQAMLKTPSPMYPVNSEAALLYRVNRREYERRVRRSAQDGL